MELKDLKTERDSLNASIKKLETALKASDKKHKAQVSELDATVEALGAKLEVEKKLKET